MAKGKRDNGKLPQVELDQIAARLRISRLALGLKSAQVCALADLKRNTYSQWEKGRGAPRLDQAKRLRKTLGYTLDWIYEGDRSGLPAKLAMAIAELESRGEPDPQEKDEAA